MIHWSLDRLAVQQAKSLSHPLNVFLMWFLIVIDFVSVARLTSHPRNTSGTPMSRMTYCLEMAATNGSINSSWPVMRRLSTCSATQISSPSMLFEINVGLLFFFFFSFFYYYYLPTKSSRCVFLSLEIKHGSCGLCLNPWPPSASGSVSQATIVKQLIIIKQLM